MRLRPLHDWVLLRIEREEKSPGGIVIPDTAKERPREGIVVAAGPGRYEEPEEAGKGEKRFIATEVEPGQRVLYEPWAANEVRLDGEEFILVRERNILGIKEG
ncbi:MAG TPA: co-chaperone GroES [Nitrospirae bacterium]|nr:co-chaperone GroES [Nitrospirota bacterium]